MGEGLSDLWGLAKSTVSDAASEVQQAARTAMDEALGTLNAGLQSAATDAPPEQHAALDTNRQKLCEAYQMASSQMADDESQGQSAMNRVLAAADKLGQKAAQVAEAAAAEKSAWVAGEEQFDEMALKVAELEDAGHPKSDALRQLTETIRTKAHGQQYGDSVRAVEQLQPKLDAILAEHEAMIAAAEAQAATDGNQQQGSWWDRAKEAAGDAVDWMTGDDDADPVGGHRAKFGNEEEGEEIVDTDEEDYEGDDDSVGDPSAEEEGDEDAAPEGEVGAAEISIMLLWASNNKPVANATVTLTSLNSGTSASGTTNPDGMATISNLAPELWTATSINKGGRTYAAAGFADCTSGGLEPMNLCIVPQIDGEDGEAVETDERGWDELSDAERRDWGILGWNKERWNGNNPPDTYSMSWWDLSGAQRQAATNLGYGENSWNNEGPHEDDDPLDTRMSWDDMHPIHQQLWGVLGWDKKKWDNNTPPPSQFKPWSELTPAEQDAARQLGYDGPADWDTEGQSGVQGRIESLKVRSHNERALRSRVMKLSDLQGEDINEYVKLYDQVGDYLEFAADGRQFSEWELDSWSRTIAELADRRRRVAGRMGSDVYEDKRNAAVTQLANLRNNLRSQRASLTRIKNAWAVAKNMQEGVDNAVALNDWLTTLENILSLKADPSALQAIDSAIAELVNQVDNTGDQISQFTGQLAAYVRKREAQLEGYESMGALLNQINATVSNIRQTARSIAVYNDKYKAAAALESTPGG